MAYVKAKYEPVKPTPPPVIQGYTLELSVEEAQLIRSLIGNCNGSLPVVNSLYSALNQAGLTRNTLGSLPTIDLKEHYQRGY